MLNPPMSSIPAMIVAGPIEMSGYDHIRLAVDHEACLPDGTTVPLPAGTLLVMVTPGGVGLQYRGVAVKNPGAADSRDGDA